jgi:hypothetical protein
MFVHCEYYVLSCRSLCVRPITLQRSPTDCGVSEYDREASINRRLLCLEKTNVYFVRDIQQILISRFYCDYCSPTCFGF